MSQFTAAAFDLGGDFGQNHGVRFDDAHADQKTRAKFGLSQLTINTPKAKLTVKSPAAAPKAQPTGMNGPKFFN